jgi:CRISPR-associated protein Cmr5
MKKRIEAYLPDAIAIISEVGIADNNDEVDSKFNGYFSSFGAAIVLSGLKPALAFYSNTKTAKERSKILKAVYKLMVDRSLGQEVEAVKLLHYYIANENDKMLKYKILDAAVALKLAVRTYKFKD